MSHQSSVDSDHQYSFPLLPWWVNESLDETQSRRVAQHVDRCPTCRAEISLLEACARAVREDPVDRTDVDAALARVNRRIDHTSAIASTSALRTRLTAWLSGAGGPALAMATAALLLLILLAPLRFGPDAPATRGEFEVLSTPSGSAAVLALDVMLDESVHPQDARRQLTRFVDEKRVKGISELGPQRFRLRLDATVDPDTLQALIARLEQQPSVRAVEITSR